MGRQHKLDEQSQGALVEESQFDLEHPRLYRVVIFNDDYTPMDFVTNVLERVFAMRHEKAVEVMLQVHLSGKAVCGIFAYDIAETKVTQVNEYARAHEYPLLCSLEPID